MSYLFGTRTIILNTIVSKNAILGFKTLFSIELLAKKFVKGFLL